MIILWDILGVLAVIGVLALAFAVILFLGAVDEERWWKNLEREHRERDR